MSQLLLTKEAAEILRVSEEYYANLFEQENLRPTKKEGVVVIE